MNEFRIENPGSVERAVVRLYAQDFPTRIYTLLRLKLSPLIQITKYVPDKGHILDLGCGSGIFANILSLKTPGRKIFGVDLSSRRIETARRISRGNPNLEFKRGDVNTISFQRLEIVTLIDLLHHMPFDEQETLLQKLHRKLDEGDILIIKDLEKSPYWKYLFHYIQDSISYRFARLYFRSAGDMQNLLRNQGFEVETVSLANGYPHPHVLYRCRKKASS